VIAQLPGWSDRRLARWLVAWWVGSVVTLVLLAAYYVLPIDVQTEWLSWWGLRIIGMMTAAWLFPGFLLGGWKALLVAAGRSSIRTTTDKALIVVFSLWAFGWPVIILIDVARNPF
jgi:hypothetical protein